MKITAHWSRVSKTLWVLTGFCSVARVDDLLTTLALVAMLLLEVFIKIEDFYPDRRVVFVGIDAAKLRLKLWVLRACLFACFHEHYAQEKERGRVLARPAGVSLRVWLCITCPDLLVPTCRRGLHVWAKPRVSSLRACPDLRGREPTCAYPDTHPHACISNREKNCRLVLKKC